jgi:ssDNA-binding Zn-finger/Zn-ribbon topoisomerase 1
MKKLPKTLVRLIFILIAGQFLSCSKNPRCWGEDKNKGIIKNSINSDIKCLPKTKQTEFIILDDSSFVKTFGSACSLPNVDFNSESLLGLYAEGGCKVKFIRKVIRKDSEKKYHYKVTVKDCGYCKSLIYSYNLVTVPKLPSGWTVTFETKTK